MSDSFNLLGNRADLELSGDLPDVDVVKVGRMLFVQPASPRQHREGAHFDARYICSFGICVLPRCLDASCEAFSAGYVG